MNAFNKAFARVAAAGVVALAPVAALADNPFQASQNMLTSKVQGASGLQSGDLPTIVGNIINVVLGFLGILLLGYLLYAGFLWMTAGGAEDQVKKAKAIIQQSIIGLVIIAAAFAISTFVLGSLLNVTNH
jgi:hypothetical protein